MVTKDNIVDGIFYQDKEMKHMSTYKLNDLCMPIYLFVVEDENGETEIVAVWLVLV